MGRKIEMKKIDDVTKCQVTFSKRRSSLMKKANEIAICCDVDVAFVAFSPSGRISKYCNQKRIEDVLRRYVSLPAESRLCHMDNVEKKLEKVRHLDHIKNDASKLQYLEKQIENLELQIKKSGLQLQILEANLRDYDLNPDLEPSLHQLSWCERNINHSLEKVIARKNALFASMAASRVQPNFQINQMELQKQGDTLFSANYENEMNLPPRIPTAEQALMEVDTWLCPPSAKNTLLDQTNVAAPKMNPQQSNICNFFSDVEIPSLQMPQQQPFLIDQTLLDFPQQSFANAWNTYPSASFTNPIIQNATQGLSTMQPSRFGSAAMVANNGSGITMPQQEPIQNSLQYANMNFANMEGVEIGNDMGSVQGAPYEVQPQKEACQDTALNNTQPEDAIGEDTSNGHGKNNFWEWEDLLIDENFNLGGLSK